MLGASSERTRFQGRSVSFCAQRHDLCVILSPQAKNLGAQQRRFLVQVPPNETWRVSQR
jgi:hypothetical protein